MVIHLKAKLINSIKIKMKPLLNKNQINELNETLKSTLKEYDVIKKNKELTILESKENQELLDNFLSSKQVEGCSERTIDYYKTTINKMVDCVNLKIESITTDDLRKYLSDDKKQTDVSKTTIGNIRSVLSSFFSWLED